MNLNFQERLEKFDCYEKHFHRKLLRKRIDVASKKKQKHNRKETNEVKNGK